MYEALRKILGGDKFAVCEQIKDSKRDAKYAPIPRFLFDSRVGLCLHQWFKERGSEKLLWAHQAQALESLGRKRNVVMSTGTASGKSLVFQSLAFHNTLLNPGNRVLVFYPLKALVSDQFRSWQQMAMLLKIKENTIGRIDGQVLVKERENILKNSQIVLMTPDVCHAWLMHRLSSPAVKDFVRALSVVVMDEAHSLEGVFGSNFAFLIRRLIAARNYLTHSEEGTPYMQFIAATATIKNPGEHMKQLTGLEFSVVDHQADGAPRHERLIAHVKCSDGNEIQVAKKLQDCALACDSEYGFITFLDSRKGVEKLAIAGEEKELLGNATILPYRAGYGVADRELIEQRLQTGKLRGVVSTSALELGIDIPHLRVGLNLGVPWSRKAYRQRLGRIGRNGPGVFLMIAPDNAFRGYGTSFHEYHNMSVEPSYLYLDNRFMQFAHARCLVTELESLGAPMKFPPRIDWPKGFKDMFLSARPGENRLPEYDAIASLGGDTPHHGYPLRNVGEANYQLKKHTNGDSFGNVNQLHALRECYPGATYLHVKQAYKVVAWHTNSFDSFIRLKNTSPARSTRPIIKKWINTGTARTDIYETNYRSSEQGLLAECQMQITERVEGYKDGRGQSYYYQELQQNDPNMRARSRNFRTSGVVLYVKEDWFKKSIKHEFAERLREIFVREYSVVPQDIGVAATNISVQCRDGVGLRRGCVAIYDEIYGSLRLTENLYLNFDHLLTRLTAAVAADSGEHEFDATVTKIRDVVSSFTEGGAGDKIIANTRASCIQVFKTGSRVCYQQSGQMAEDVEIVQPAIMEEQLWYQVKAHTKNNRPWKRWVNASLVEPSAEADAWEYVWWNLETQEYDEPSDSNDR